MTTGDNVTRQSPSGPRVSSFRGSRWLVLGFLLAASAGWCLPIAAQEKDDDEGWVEVSDHEPSVTAFPITSLFRKARPQTSQIAIHDDGLAEPTGDDVGEAVAESNDSDDEEVIASDNEHKAPSEKDNEVASTNGEPADPRSPTADAVAPAAKVADTRPRFRRPADLWQLWVKAAPEPEKVQPAPASEPPAAKKDAGLAELRRLTVGKHVPSEIKLHATPEDMALAQPPSVEVRPAQGEIQPSPEVQQPGVDVPPAQMVEILPPPQFQQPGVDGRPTQVVEILPPAEVMQASRERLAAQLEHPAAQLDPPVWQFTPAVFSERMRPVSPMPLVMRLFAIEQTHPTRPAKVAANDSAASKTARSGPQRVDVWRLWPGTSPQFTDHVEPKAEVRNEVSRGTEPSAPPAVASTAPAVPQAVPAGPAPAGVLPAEPVPVAKPAEVANSPAQPLVAAAPVAVATEAPAKTSVVPPPAAPAQPAAIAATTAPAQPATLPQTSAPAQPMATATANTPAQLKTPDASETPVQPAPAAQATVQASPAAPAQTETPAQSVEAAQPAVVAAATTPNQPEPVVQAAVSSPPAAIAPAVAPAQPAAPVQAVAAQSPASPATDTPNGKRIFIRMQPPQQVASRPSPPRPAYAEEEQSAPVKQAVPSPVLNEKRSPATNDLATARQPALAGKQPVAPQAALADEERSDDTEDLPVRARPALAGKQPVAHKAAPGDEESVAPQAALADEEPAAPIVRQRPGRQSASSTVLNEEQPRGTRGSPIRARAALVDQQPVTPNEASVQTTYVPSPAVQPPPVRAAVAQQATSRRELAQGLPIPLPPVQSPAIQPVLPRAAQVAPPVTTRPTFARQSFENREEQYTPPRSQAMTAPPVQPVASRVASPVQEQVRRLPATQVAATAPAVIPLPPVAAVARPMPAATAIPMAIPMAAPPVASPTAPAAGQVARVTPRPPVGRTAKPAAPSPRLPLVLGPDGRPLPSPRAGVVPVRPPQQIAPATAMDQAAPSETASAANGWHASAIP